MKPTATNATPKKVLSNRLQRYKERGPEYIKKKIRLANILFAIGFIVLPSIALFIGAFFDENFAWYAESAIRVGAFGFSIFLFYLLHLILLASLALLLFGLGSVIYWTKIDLKIAIADDKIKGEQLLKVGRNSGLHFIISGLISAVLATMMIFILINY